MPVIIRDDIMQSIEKPARYTGGELNSIRKEHSSVDIRFAFCFPDVYEVGMSHLGMRILYHLLNERTDTCCERVFAPWPDMEAMMRKNGIPLFSLESREPIGSFDFIGFTLQYEMSYTNILNMLDLSAVPLLSRNRKAGQPFVCAGGPCACNPEPLADFVDFFMLGEGEEIINEVMDAYKEWKKEGVSREAFLNKIVGIEGIYVPGFYEPSYNDDGTVRSVEPINPAYPLRIRKRIIRDLDNAYYPDKIIVPYTSIVHDRIMLELFRGCARGCRFCQAGFIYRPVRERTPSKLVEMAKKLENSTGYEEISLISLSTSDYSDLPRLTSDLNEEMQPKKVNLALPSLRIDSFSLELMEKVQTVRKSGLTFAPEAGTQRLRDIINKGVTEENLLDSVGLAFRGGWNGVKLYFMIGLPFETMEDVEGIAVLGRKVLDKYYKTPREQRGKGLEVTISTSSFVPKPFTPFQWEAQDKIETLSQKQRFLKGNIKDRHMRFSWNDPELSLLEAVFSRGDRKTGRVLAKAWELGCKFDSWGEHFKYDLWLKAFDNCGIDPAFYANRRRDYTEVFPWDHIDIGVSKKFLASARGTGLSTYFKEGERDTDTIAQDNDKTCAYHKDNEQAGHDCGTSVTNVRVKFTRGEEVKFISHLDLMKVFERAIRRSGLPIAYSQGFNPHPQMVFGLPLSVGVTSDGEYADFELIRKVEPGRFMDELNSLLPKAIRITAAAEKHIKANIMATISGADYSLDIFLNETLSLEAATEKLDMLMERDCIKVLKEGKGAVKEIDMRPMVLEARLEAINRIPFGYEDFKAAFTILTRFSAGSTANLRPELFIRALVEQAGFPVASSRLHRRALYVEKHGRMVDPLDNIVLNNI